MSGPRSRSSNRRDAEWYEGLRNVPGVAYEGHPDVDRTKLRQHNAKPQVETYDFEGEEHTSILWRTRDGWSSQSPASAWSSSGDPRTAKPEKILRSRYEALELPGTVADYHRKLLGVAGMLCARRKQHPEFLADVEKILLLDISLVRAQSDSLTIEHNGERVTLGAAPFSQLVSLYEDEGFVHEALEIANMATAAGYGSADAERLSKRVAELSR